MVDRDEDVNKLKWVVSTLEQQIHFLFLYFDWFRCHQNHVLFFFSPQNVICSKLFWLWFQVDRFFPENTLPRFFSLVGRKGELGFPFAYLLVFKLNNLRIYTDLFCFLRDVLYSEAGPSSLGCSGPFLPRTSLAGPWGRSGPSPVTPHTFRALECVFPRMLPLVTAVEVSCRHSLTFSVFLFFFFF